MEETQKLKIEIEELKEQRAALIALFLEVNDYADEIKSHCQIVGDICSAAQQPMRS